MGMGSPILNSIATTSKYTLPRDMIRQNGSGLESRQPRFTQQNFSNFLRWVGTGFTQEPPYKSDSRARDAWLMDFWRRETLLAGVLNNVIMIDANRGWSLIGGRNQVARYTQILHNSEDGQGWRHFAKRASLSFWATDMGAVNEVGRDGENGPLRSLWNVDSTRCSLTGNPERPLQYQPNRGPVQFWEPGDYFRVASMPQVDEGLNGLGYCAVSRALNFAKLMWAVYEHDKEMLDSKMMKGLLLLNNIGEAQWQQAMESRKDQMEAKEREIYGGVQVLAGMGEFGAADAKLIALSSLPAGFNQETMTNILMFGYSLCFGYDPREFWPVSQGPLGTGKETETQAEKATTKGGGDFRLSFQERFQQEIPETIHFEFQERDDSGALLGAQVAQAQVDVIQTMSQLGEKFSTPYLSQEEIRQLLAMDQLIPEEWTAQEEESVATDEESLRARVLEMPEVRRACEEYPGDPIVQYTCEYHGGVMRERVKTLWDSGQEALSPKVWYQGDGWELTQRDIERAKAQSQETGIAS